MKLDAEVWELDLMPRRPASFHVEVDAKGVAVESTCTGHPSHRSEFLFTSGGASSYHGPHVQVIVSEFMNYTNALTYQVP